MARIARRAGFTTRATCLLAAGVTAVLCGFVFGEVDLVRAGLLAVAIPCVAAVVVHRSQLRIANRRSVEPTDVLAGDAVTVQLLITNRSALRTGSLMLEDTLPDFVDGRARFVVDPLGGHEARPVSYRIPELGRGRYRVGPLVLRLSDPFRMIDHTRSFAATSEFVVGPVVDRLPAVEPPTSDDLGENAGSRSVGTYGADDQSTREYRTGDDLRKIHWRSSARIGALMVRQEERPWQGSITLLLDTRASAHASTRTGGRSRDRAGAQPSPADSRRPDPRQASSFEWAVSAVASIGTHVLVAGRKLGVVDPAGSERQPFADVTRLRRHLAEIREVGRSDLSAAARVLRSAGHDSTVVAVVGRLDSASVRALAEAHARGRSSPAYALLLDVDSWSAAAPGEGAPLPPLTTEFVRAGEMLRSAGWRVSFCRRGDTTAAAWQLLLAGTAGQERRTVGAR